VLAATETGDVTGEKAMERNVGHMKDSGKWVRNPNYATGKLAVQTTTEMDREIQASAKKKGGDSPKETSPGEGGAWAIEIKLR